MTNKPFRTRRCGSGRRPEAWALRLHRTHPRGRIRRSTPRAETIHPGATASNGAELRRRRSANRGRSGPPISGEWLPWTDASPCREDRPAHTVSVAPHPRPAGVIVAPACNRRRQDAYRAPMVVLTVMTEEDRELDVLWRQVFHQPCRCWERPMSPGPYWRSTPHERRADERIQGQAQEGAASQSQCVPAEPENPSGHPGQTQSLGLGRPASSSRTFPVLRNRTPESRRRKPWRTRCVV